MQRTPQRDNRLELAVRARLHRSGARFRVHYRPVRGSNANADIAFPRQKLAILIDGCFWHRCPSHATKPRSNEAWWAQKLEENVRRDRRFDTALAGLGWRVLRFWEHEGVEAIVGTIHAALAREPYLPGRKAKGEDGREAEAELVVRTSGGRNRLAVAG